VQGGAKQPFNFSMADNAVLAFAGLWESWNDNSAKIDDVLSIEALSID
jgi:putative SOS response-associated peptidase YedK